MLNLNSINQSIKVILEKQAAKWVLPQSRKNIYGTIMMAELYKVSHVTDVANIFVDSVKILVVA